MKKLCLNLTPPTLGPPITLRQAPDHLVVLNGCSVYLHTDSTALQTDGRSAQSTPWRGPGRGNIPALTVVQEGDAGFSLWTDKNTFLSTLVQEDGTRLWTFLPPDGDRESRCLRFMGGLLLQGSEADPVALIASPLESDSSTMALQATPLSQLGARPSVGSWTLTLAVLPVIPVHLFSLIDGDGPIHTGTSHQSHTPQEGTAAMVGQFTAKAIRDLGGFLVDWGR
jgi:hypothetical protein